MLSKVLMGRLFLEVLLVIDIVVSVLWEPVWITHLVFFEQILLGSPQVFVAMWVLLRWEVSNIFWNEHLILSHQVMNTHIHLVLEESVWNTQVVIWMHSQWKLSWNWIPWVLVHFPDWGITESHHGHLIISCCWPENLDLFSLRVGDNLSGEIGLVSFVENVNTVVDDDVSEIDFFFWGESKLLNSQCFLSGQTWSSSHNFLNISRLWSMIPWTFHLTIHLSDVFHSVRTIIWWDWSTLSNRMNMSHVIHWRWWVGMLSLNDFIVVFGFWHTLHDLK
jgi:hypothetical protein